MINETLKSILEKYKGNTKYRYVLAYITKNGKYYKLCPVIGEMTEAGVEKKLSMQATSVPVDYFSSDTGKVIDIFSDVDIDELVKEDYIGRSTDEEIDIDEYVDISDVGFQEIYRKYYKGH